VTVTKKTTFIFSAVLLVLLSIPSLRAQTRGSSFFEVKASDGAVVASFSESHALVIGESEYTNGWRRLPGVKEDVVAVKALFEEMGFTVETLQDARSRELREGIQNFFDKYGFNPNSRLILYFAGHGATLTLATNSRMGYIVPVDAPHPDNDRTGFQRTAIAMDQFNTWAKTYDSRHILFMFDSCFSGTVFRSSGARPPSIDRNTSLPVRQFITAGDADEEVPDESIFRRQLEAALRYGLADPSGTGYVNGTALGEYLYNTVSSYMNGKQNPRYGKVNNHHQRWWLECRPLKEAFL
jgi:hypothetical protein